MRNPPPHLWWPFCNLSSFSTASGRKRLWFLTPFLGSWFSWDLAHFWGLQLLGLTGWGGPSSAGLSLEACASVYHGTVFPLSQPGFLTCLIQGRPWAQREALQSQEKTLANAHRVQISWAGALSVPGLCVEEAGLEGGGRCWRVLVLLTSFWKWQPFKFSGVCSFFIGNRAEGLTPSVASRGPALPCFLGSSIFLLARFCLSLGFLHFKIFSFSQSCQQFQRPSQKA